MSQLTSCLKNTNWNDEKLHFEAQFQDELEQLVFNLDSEDYATGFIRETNYPKTRIVQRFKGKVSTG